MKLLKSLQEPMFWIAMIWISIPGCSKNEGASAFSETRKSDSQESPEVNPSFNIIPIDQDGLSSWIRNSHRRYIVVDFWASWCGPCVKNFPKFVALTRQYQERGLEAVYVNFDELEEVAATHEFMQAHGVNGQAFVRKQKMIEAFEGFDLNSLPTYRLYDGQGNMLENFDGVDAFEELSKAIHVRFGGNE